MGCEKVRNQRVSPVVPFTAYIVEPAPIKTVPAASTVGAKFGDPVNPTHVVHLTTPVDAFTA